ncbi:MAG: DUF4919 domain-containing protein [Prevotella sp.]|nr:DUF4919 domain-containing protein [Prevotella sp.]
MKNMYNVHLRRILDIILKYPVLCTLFAFNTLCVYSQSGRQLIPVEWKAIKREVKKNPEKVKDLVARLAAPKIDTTLTFSDRILAFYGQSFLTNDGEEGFVLDMDKLSKEGKYDECLEAADKVLDKNPLNLDALIMKGNVLLVMSKDSVRWPDVTQDDAMPYFNRAMRIFNTIATTGDGSEKHPFYVTKVSDEYNFMRYYLDLWEYEGQYVTGHCDAIKLKEKSLYYDQPEIYFDVTRVFELERLMFK